MDIAGKRGLAGTTSASDGESISAEIETDFNNFSFNWGLLFTSLWVVISSKFNLNRLKMILCIFTALKFSLALNAQNSGLNYFAQYYNYGLNDMSGLRQTLCYSYGFSKKISIEFQLFTESGRGTDISKNFKKDFVLLSKANSGNTPEFLTSFNEYNEGIYSYDRISDGLKQDNGWGMSVKYLLLDESKLKVSLCLGYLVYNTKAVLTASIFDVKVSLPNDNTISDYKISYPSKILMNYDDGAAFTRMDITHNMRDRLAIGLNTNINYSTWSSGIDIGIGILLAYRLNKTRE